MQRSHQKISFGGAIAPFLLFLNAIVLQEGFVTNTKWYWLLALTLPMFVMTLIMHNRKAS